MTQIITRYAPSPTGMLHIGNVRSALFCYLHARQNGGKFLLRIEDTDLERSTEEAVQVIYSGMKWLGLEWDNTPVIQSRNIKRHRDVAQQLLDADKAYHCYMTAEELTAEREAAQIKGEVYRYDRRWRDSTETPPEGVKPVVRLKAPLSGTMDIVDYVQGEATLDVSELDDFILLRADGSPTYMLSCVVDDHDMGVTDVVRGDDHFRNAYRQTLLYQAMGWAVPRWGHLPTVLDDEGRKMSKRRAGAALHYYQDEGYPADAVFNALIRLGWSHGDDEIISREQAIEWFRLSDVSKSPARFDADKLDHLAAHYLNAMNDSELMYNMIHRIEKRRGDQLNKTERMRLTAALPLLKERSKTTAELAAEGYFLVAPLPLILDEKAKEVFDTEAQERLSQIKDDLLALQPFTADTISAFLKERSKAMEIKMKHLAMPLRAALTGTMASPSLFQVMEILGAAEVGRRLESALQNAPQQASAA